MKTYLPIIALGLFLTGCGLLTKPIVTQQQITIPASTNVVSATNYPLQTVSLAITNDVITYITNTPPPVVITHTIIQPERLGSISVTNWVPNTGFIEVAKQVNSSVNPTPSEPVINLALAGLTGLAGLLAAWQNRKSNKATDVATTMIKAIEDLPPELTQPVKDAVSRMSEHRDNVKDVDAVVQKVT